MKEFKPKHMIITSMKKVPEGTKLDLKRLRIETVDELRPENPYAIQRFQSLVKEFLI